MKIIVAGRRGVDSEVDDEDDDCDDADDVASGVDFH